MRAEGLSRRSNVSYGILLYKNKCSQSAFSKSPSLVAGVSTCLRALARFRHFEDSESLKGLKGLSGLILR